MLSSSFLPGYKIPHMTDKHRRIFSEAGGRTLQRFVAVTHHLDVGVLGQQAVIGHGLKGEKSSGQIRRPPSLSMLTRQQEPAAADA